MNRLEFNETMKTLGIYNPVLSTNISGSLEDIHIWKNNAIYFGGSYYAIIKGKIPYEVASIIYKKYPNNPYGIRINGGCLDYKPQEFATDDKHEKDVQKYIEENLEAKDYLKKCRIARKNLLRRTDENKYIDTYHIDTKEGLIILLTEMADYYARKEGLKETEVKKYDEYLATITSNILEKVKPSITTYEWMQADEENSETFKETISNTTKTTFGKMFRNILDEFDKTVNPYINADIELDEVENYLKKVKIDANIYNSINGKTRKNCCRMYITDLETNNRVAYSREPDGFLYQLTYTLGEEQYLNIMHSFSNISSDKAFKGEIVHISYSGKNIPYEININYNITTGVAYNTYNQEEVAPITPEKKEYIYDELLKGIALASEITIKNMKKKGIEKKLKK